MYDKIKAESWIFPGFTYFFRVELLVLPAPNNNHLESSESSTNKARCNTIIKSLKRLKMAWHGSNDFAEKAPTSPVEKHPRPISEIREYTRLALIVRRLPPPVDQSLSSITRASCV